MRPSARALVAVIFVAVLLGATACAAAPDGSAQAGTGTFPLDLRVERNGSTTTYSRPNGASIVSGTTLPDGWPADVLLYQPNTVFSGSVATWADGQELSVGMEAHAQFADVRAWYETQLAAQGWTMRPRDADPDGWSVILEGQKSGHRTIYLDIVQYPAQKDSTTVSVSVMTTR